MSTENAKIKRTLLINSPIHLWKLLKTRNEILQINQKLNVFCYYVDKYLNGCMCDDDQNKSYVNNEYNSIRQSISIIEFLKDNFGCNEVIFSESEWK